MRIASRLISLVFVVLLCLLLGPEGLTGGGGPAESPRSKKGLSFTSTKDAPNTRVRKGLVVVYDFGSSDGSTVKDRSGLRPSVDLRITSTRAVRRTRGALEIRSNTLIRSDRSASRLINAIRQSGEITLEAWIRPARANQSGPARIFTLSANPNNRNFTLGQDGDRVDVRFRTTRTSKNGLPSLSSPRRSLSPRVMHVVYARNRRGRTQLYIDGKRRGQRTVAGSPSNWDRSFRLALANELTGDRPWLGTYYLLAVYNRDLSPEEIQRNFKAGVRAATVPVEVVQTNPRESARLFKTQIAPLLARHCVECHGRKSKKGRLDLSRKETAFQGGSGKVIVPGKPAKSLLWKMVYDDEMPKNRPPLSTRQKRYLRQWIDTGANWAGDAIDPLAYQHRKKGSNWVRRLTVEEYIETVRAAVGVEIATDARKILPRDLRADGFSNTAYNLNVDLGHVEAYARLARIIVDRMDVVKFAAQYTSSQQLNEANFRKLISGMGKWLLRGPLEEHEIAAFLRIPAVVIKEKGTYEEAVRYLLQAMLQSPRFIYRMEKQDSEGKARSVGPYELASRLSYILWGGPPDRELIRAADADELAQRNQVRTQVQRMLKDPRAIRHSSRFIAEWLNLDRLNHLRPNRKRFPGWDDQIARDMREETLAYFHEVVWKQNRPLTALFNSQFTYATPRLARHYGLKPRGKRLTRYDLSSVPGRGGLLTQGSVLTVGGDEASMVARGLFVLHDVLDGEVNDPPPGVDTTPVPTKPGLSQRSIASARIANPSCGGCHGKFEPLAFGLEKFDGLGAYLETDRHGNKLREDGKILFPGKDKPVAYKTSAELMSLLASSERVQQTITKKVTQWALGRPLVKEDAPVLARIHQAVKQGGGTYRSVLTAIVMSDLVQKTPHSRGEKQP